MTGAADRDAILLACSGLGAPRGGAAEPFGPKGWATVAERAAAAGLAPGDLVRLSAAELESRLRVPTADASRLADLFARHGQLAFELERLERLGIWVDTIASPAYPGRLLDRLGPAAPPVLFGLGDRTLLEADGLAVIGSRDADEDALGFATRAGELAASQGWSLVSGAARGVDAASMRGAFDAGGTVVGVTADGLERHLRDASLRAAFALGQAVYLSAYRPDAPFSVGAAMGRNKLIYCLSRAALVVHSTAGSGGTWSGAIEAIAAGWVPVLVNAGTDAPGNPELIRRGGIPVREADLEDLTGLLERLAALDKQEPIVEEPVAAQQTLF